MPSTNGNQQDQLINDQNNNSSDEFLRYSMVNNMRYLLTDIDNQVSITTRLIDHRIRRYWGFHNEDINMHLPYENYYADEIEYMNPPSSPNFNHQIDEMIIQPIVTSVWPLQDQQGEAVNIQPSNELQGNVKHDEQMGSEVPQFPAESKDVDDQEPQQSSDTHTIVPHLSMARGEDDQRKRRRIDEREPYAQVSDNSTTEYLEQMPNNETEKCFCGTQLIGHDQYFCMQLHSFEFDN